MNAELRRLLIRDQPERDAIAEQLLRHRTSGAHNLADLIDMLTIDYEARRRVVRVLGELEAGIWSVQGCRNARVS